MFRIYAKAIIRLNQNKYLLKKTAFITHFKIHLGIEVLQFEPHMK